jgi:hypothetical protein
MRSKTLVSDLVEVAFYIALVLSWVLMFLAKYDQLLGR